MSATGLDRSRFLAALRVWLPPLVWVAFFVGVAAFNGFGVPEDRRFIAVAVIGVAFFSVPLVDIARRAVFDGDRLVAKRYLGRSIAFRWDDPRLR